MSTIEQRLQALNITLPTPAAPVANYVPFMRSGNLLFISGQLPMGPNGLAYKGKVPTDIPAEEGKAAAKLCAINLLAQAKAALGNLENITRCVKIGGFVNCPPDFYDHASIINGASDFLVEILGDAGRHARAAIGSSALPLNAAVEVEAIFEVK
jgi:enamine deaminase RidA (YjgF/YER057c/UK114 family)